MTAAFCIQRRWPGVPGWLLIALACGAPAHGAEVASASSRDRNGVAIHSKIPEAMLDRAIVPEAEVDEITAATLVLQGPINRAMRDRFNGAVARGGFTTVRITSQGGDAVEAMKIAATIRAGDFDVVARDLCLGACAQYIFVAGRKRLVEKGTLVGFNASIKGNAAIARIATEILEVRNPIAPWLDETVAAEEELYRRSAVAVSMLMDVQIAVQPRCVIMDRDGAERMSWSTSGTYVLWVPTRKYLNAAGVQFEGDWPSSRRQMTQLADRFLKSEALPWLRYGDEDQHKGRGQKAYTLQKLESCVTDLVTKSAAQSQDQPGNGE